MNGYKNHIIDLRNELEKIALFFKNELQKLRTGRATPFLVEDILIDCYNAKMSLKQIAAISCPEPRQILIQPWDKALTEQIIRGISSRDLGINPIADKQSVRINLPPLTEEFRRNLISQISKKEELSRESVRKTRDRILKEIQQKFQDKGITEDEKFKARDEVQRIIDEYNKKLSEHSQAKRKEILES